MDYGHDASPPAQILLVVAHDLLQMPPLPPVCERSIGLEGLSL